MNSVSPRHDLNKKYTYFGLIITHLPEWNFALLTSQDDESSAVCRITSHQVN